MKRYDLHVHTDASPCSRASPEDVVDAAIAAGLDGIAVTDHDTTENVARVEALAPSDLHVVSGAEVTTATGHLLALGVREPPPIRLPPETAVDAVHERGGLAVLAHPFDRLREHYGHDELRDPDQRPLASAVDGMEVVNSRCLRESFNRRADRFAQRNDVATTAGSDAHFPMEVGRAHTAFEGSLREALSDGTTLACGRGRYLSGHAATKLHQAAARLGV